VGVGAAVPWSHRWDGESVAVPGVTVGVGVGAAVPGVTAGVGVGAAAAVPGVTAGVGEGAVATGSAKMAAKKSGTRLEIEIERCRNECLWEKIPELVKQLSAKLIGNGEDPRPLLAIAERPRVMAAAARGPGERCYI